MDLATPLLQRYDPQRGSLYQFWMGIRFFWLGWRLLWRSAGLLLTSLVPVLMTAAILAGLAYLSFQLTGQLLGGIPTQLPIWLEDALQALSSMLVVLVVTFFGFFPLVTLASVPFRDALAAQTERLLLGQKSSAANVPLWQTLFDVLRLVSLQIALLVLTLSLSWILPGVGQIVALLVAMYLATLDMLDAALSRRGFNLTQKIGFLRRHLALGTGFGLMAFGLLLIPLINLLIWPVATIGGTALVLGALTDPEH